MVSHGGRGVWFSCSHVRCVLRYPLRRRDDDLSSVEPCVYPSSLVRPYTCFRGFDIGCVVRPTRLILMTGQVEDNAGFIL
jgi:hypothetical protein